MTTAAPTGNGNGKDWTSLKAWASAIGVIGIPGAIAIFLVYIGATEIPKLVKNQELAVIEIQMNQRLLESQLERLERLTRLLQRVCSNTARDDQMRQRCFDP